jgi:hypothetical protein
MIAEKINNSGKNFAHRKKKMIIKKNLTLR